MFNDILSYEHFEFVNCDEDNLGVLQLFDVTFRKDFGPWKKTEVVALLEVVLDKGTLTSFASDLATREDNVVFTLTPATAAC